MGRVLRADGSIPLQICAQQQNFRALGRIEGSLSTTLLPSLGSYQLWHAPRVMEAGAIARAKPRRPAAGGTICFSSGVNCEEEKI